MANDLELDFGFRDRASGTLRKVKAESDATQRSLKQTAEGLSKAGGELGAMGARGAGLAALPGTLRLVAVAVLAVGTAWNAVLAASDRAVENAKEQVTWAQKLRDATTAAGKARDAQAMGGVGQIGTLRKQTALGISDAEIKRMQQQTGMSREDAVDTEAAIRRSPAAMRENLRAKVFAGVRTGLVGGPALVAELAKQGGNSPDLYRAMLAAQGQAVNPAALQQVKDAVKNTDAFDNYAGGTLIRSLNTTAWANDATTRGGIADLKSGATLNALVTRNLDAQALRSDPGAVARKQVQDEADKMEEALKAASAAQFRIVAALRDAGSGIGLTDQSERGKLRNFQRNTEAVRD